MLQGAVLCPVLSCPLPYPESAILICYRVTKQLGCVVKDRKRVVRQEAARARNTWYLVTQP